MTDFIPQTKVYMRLEIEHVHTVRKRTTLCLRSGLESKIESDFGRPPSINRKFYEYHVAIIMGKASIHYKTKGEGKESFINLKQK